MDTGRSALTQRILPSSGPGPLTSQDAHNDGDNETEGIMHLMKTQGFGWFIRFDPAEIAAWLDGARHPERSTAGDRTHLAVSFSRSASRIREIACLDSGRQTDCARSGDLPLVAEDLRDTLE